MLMRSCRARYYKHGEDFLKSNTLPKSIIHTNVLLIPKKDLVESFTDLIPSSLNNYMNKVIYRMIDDNRGFTA